MHKRITYLLLCVLLVMLSLSACTPAQPKTVRIAFVGPLTGVNAAVGIGAMNSFEMKVKEILASGDYPYPIEIVYEDDASDPAIGMTVADKLCADKNVVAAATHWNSPVGLATVDIFHKCGMAQIFWGTIHSDIMYANEYDNNFRVIATSKGSNDLAAEYARKFNRMNWVIIHDTTDYGFKNRNEFKAAIEAIDGKILGIFSVYIGQKDFSDILGNVKALNPDGIYYGGVVAEGAEIRRQANQMGLNKVMFMGPPGIQSDIFGAIAGADGEGAFCSGTFDVNSTEAGRAFVKAYEEKYPNEPYEQNGPYAYDSAGIILEAIKAVGPDRAKIIKYIGSHDFAGVIGEIKWDKYGQAKTGGLTMYVNQDSRWVKYEESEYASGVRPLPWQ